MGQGALVSPGPTGPGASRRRLLRAAAASAGGGLAARLGVPTLAALAVGCSRAPEAVPGAWVGADATRGHALRDGPPPATGTPLQRSAAVVVVGAGVAGLACARALRQRGIEDVAVLELEDQPGGNARGHAMGGIACPLGAHYLPLPDPRDEPLVGLLAELGLARHEGGRLVYDERHLCHSLQERLYVGPAPHEHAWHEGLLPPVEAMPPAEQARTRDDYRRFAAAVRPWVTRGAFTVPTAGAGWSDELAALDAHPFDRWLDEQGLHAPALRWYLDYCCRDDYGAGSARVSAWAGLHYFASRHGFHAPGEDAGDDEAGLLTWPEGNGWLTRRLAAPLAGRLQPARVAWRVEGGRHGASVDAWDATAGRHERWQARQVVLAVPLFTATRLWRDAPPALAAAAARQPHAPWLVANLRLDAPLRDRPGAPPAWDNVVYGSPALGYVDAMHQSLRPDPGATVLSVYWALGGADAAAEREARRALLSGSHAHWSARVLTELQAPHPDLRQRLQRIDLMRYGHAMSIPVPGLRSDPALRALQSFDGRVHLAHADLSGYSVFEEAFFHGHRVGSALRV
jgi:predicted NAD/FAD-dependent oxidoreductase